MQVEKDDTLFDIDDFQFVAGTSWGDDLWKIAGVLETCDLTIEAIFDSLNLDDFWERPNFDLTCFVPRCETSIVPSHVHCLAWWSESFSTELALGTQVPHAHSVVLADRDEAHGLRRGKAAVIDDLSVTLQLSYDL